MKTMATVTLDVDLLSYLKENKINVSKHLNGLLVKWMSEKDGDVIKTELTDKISGAKYFLDKDGNQVFSNYDELHKYTNARASRGKKVTELSGELKERVLREIQERTVKEGDASDSKEESQEKEEVKEGEGGGKDVSEV